MLQLLPQNLENMKVFDAGCAAGWYTNELSNRGASVVATDISPEMVEATKRRVGEKAEIICLDLETKLPFEDNTFDIIISSLTLHYIKDWGQVFSEFHRVLKSNGIFLYSVHHPLMDIAMSQNKDYFSTELNIDQWKKEGKLFHIPFYRRPLHSILNETVEYFIIEKIIEPQPTLQYKMKAPESYEKLMKNPHFLIIYLQNKCEI